MDSLKFFLAFKVGDGLGEQLTFRKIKLKLVGHRMGRIKPEMSAV